ncbi:MAG: T9SS type A sorting domain-containing protein [Saprospiraceae bacterium]|nr:T9SS type A sorting domain-containing protein [Candidatus Opimibacter skivensis]
MRDANGALLSDRTLNTQDGNTQIDVTDLAPGLYFIHFIATDDGTQSQFLKS